MAGAYSRETSAAEAEALLAAGRIDAAVELFQAALSENPHDAAAVRGIARCAAAVGLHKEAEIAWCRVHELDPEDRDGLIHAGMNFERLAHYREAVDRFSRVIEKAPHDYVAHTARLQALLYSDEAELAEVQAAQIAWGALSPVAGADRRTFDNPAEPDRPLRIGYLTSDFRAHPTGLAMLPVLHFHRRPDFRIHCYVDLDQPDAATRELQARSDAWREVRDIDDASVAEMIAADRIDILVVLTPHMDRNRPFVCRHRPAPVLVAFHDPCSTFIPEIDYFIGDFTITPRHGAERFSERMLRLPCWTVQAFPAETPEIGPSPLERNGYVTFGSFNNPVKLTRTVTGLWSRVLTAVPQSRLYLKYYDAYADQAVADRVRQDFVGHGIEPSRILITERAEPRSGHFAHYDRVDIALDPFPFNGVTTTTEALLMGTPVVTLLGETLVSRSAASLLHAVGLDELITSSPDAYVEAAARLAAAPARLAELRAGLRTAVKGSRLMDARRYTRHLERYYRAMWRRWCHGHR